MRIRPPQLDIDLQTLVDIRNGCLAVTEGGTPHELWTEASMARYLTYPRICLADDLLVLDTGDEAAPKPGGFALLARSRLTADEGGAIIELWELWVNPYLDMRLLGGLLIDASLASARRRGAAVLRTTWIPEGWTWLRGLFKERGFFDARRYLTLRVGRRGLAAAPRESCAFRRLDPASGGDRAELAALYNDTFARNWGVEPQSGETLQFQVRASPDEGGGEGYGFIIHEGRAAGFLMSWLDPVRRAWVIDALGVSEAARGRGLGRALVVSALDRAREAGVDQALVSVDVQNETALRLYQGLGFEERSAFDVYELNLR
jgi:mycothiol synthase